MRFRLIVDGELHEVEVEHNSRGTTVHVDGATYRARVASGMGELRVRVGPRLHRILVRGASLLVDGVPHEIVTEVEDVLAAGAKVGTASGGPAVVEVRPPMPGRVVKLLVSPGGIVKRGQTLAVLEAMKMQNEIPAPMDALVEEVRVQEGELIAADRVIAVLATRPASTS